MTVACTGALATATPAASDLAGADTGVIPEKTLTGVTKPGAEGGTSNILAASNRLSLVDGFEDLDELDLDLEDPSLSLSLSFFLSLLPDIMRKLSAENRTLFVCFS